MQVCTREISGLVRAQQVNIDPLRTALTSCAPQHGLAITPRTCPYIHHQVAISYTLSHECNNCPLFFTTALRAMRFTSAPSLSHSLALLLTEKKQGQTEMWRDSEQVPAAPKHPSEQHSPLSPYPFYVTSYYNYTTDENNQNLLVLGLVTVILLKAYSDKV